MTEHKIHLQKLYEEFIVFSRERKETAINDLKTFSISTAPEIDKYNEILVHNMKEFLRAKKIKKYSKKLINLLQKEEIEQIEDKIKLKVEI